MKKLCGSAILGSGLASAEIAFPELPPIKVTSPVTVFNGDESGGEAKFYLYTIITVPRPTAIVTAVTIQRKGTGIHSIAKIPVIAGGSGSALSFSFKLGKTYTYKGKKIGYFEAKCPDGIFKVNVPEAPIRE